MKAGRQNNWRQSEKKLSEKKMIIRVRKKGGIMVYK